MGVCVCVCVCVLMHPILMLSYPGCSQSVHLSLHNGSHHVHEGELEGGEGRVGREGREEEEEGNGMGGRRGDGQNGTECRL